MLHSAARIVPTGDAAAVIMCTMTHNRWRLDPSRFPRRLDLDLSNHALDRLDQLSAKTGRSLSDVAADLLCQALAAQARGQN